MSKFNKNYRIRTEINKDKHIHVKLDRDYDVLEIMSLKIDKKNAYRFHTSDYGVIAGRVLANGGFGIPNAKISVFIPLDGTDANDVIKSNLYPFNATYTKDKNGVRYNLLPNEQINNCHTVIGTFPEKQFTLDNNTVLEIVEKYYKFTTRTNDAGDYLLFGIPVGLQNLHVDIDLSDIGILSQKPRDMVYKGYNISQFENPNKFKYDTNLNSLTQVISQEQITDVTPFWGDSTENVIGITRCDIDIQYKFEPTCVFMGSLVSDTGSNGFSRKCIPTPGMGAMDEITTGSGTIEMIRKTPNGTVEELQIQGTQLINGDGVWCYQIPMNLDYMMTDEFGNMVPTNDPSKGIPTRTRVRFRISMQDFDNDAVNVFRGKMLVPHNPSNASEIDYQFGTKTSEHSYRDLFWNCVYSVKSYIPRLQKGKNWRSGKFTGFKRVNYYNDNNPIPYNNIRIRLPFMYVILCALIKLFFLCCGFINRFIRLYVKYVAGSRDSSVYTLLDGTLCDENMENICIIPGVNVNGDTADNTVSLLGRTVVSFVKKLGGKVTNVNTGSDSDQYTSKDSVSIDEDNKGGLNNRYNYPNVNEPRIYGYGGSGGKANDGYIDYTGIRITNDYDYLIQCVEMNMAQEYKVIQFDFYNDWINGLIYIPRWFRKVPKKMTFFNSSNEADIKKMQRKIKACNENQKSKKINIVQQCGLKYNQNYEITTDTGCKSWINWCHKAKEVRLDERALSDSGIVHSLLNSKKQYIYYFKPIDNGNTKIKLYSTDIILLGTLNSCDKWGIPNDLKEMVSSTYQMPSNLALTDSDIEGDSYSSVSNKTGRFDGYDGDNLYGRTASSGDQLTDWNDGGTYEKILRNSENGNFTELSGIDWGYTGPLQNDKINSKADDYDFYKPGGHFLGLSCVNSETTIKSCVNLSRICEYGVLMSQRQNIDVLSGNTLENYGIVPSGLISKDEISDSNFRSIFSTLNSNKLKTIINPQTGYPIYDFKYLNPTNFGGELKNRMAGNYNRYVGVVTGETEFVYADDDETIVSEIKSTNIDPEKQIVRTGEFRDEEYLKFRFGLTGNTINNSDEFKGKFLQDYSFPMFDNSFYFYFGLHDGKTAIDEFKKQYYAVCEKMDSLVQEESPLKISEITKTNCGIDKTNGEIKVNYVVNDEYSGKVVCNLYNINDVNTSINEKKPKGNEIIFSNLTSGIYKVKLTIEDEIYEAERDVEIGEPNFVSINLKPVDFVKTIKDIDEEVVFNTDRNDGVFGGYIEFDGSVVCTRRDGTNVSLDTDYIDEIILTTTDTKGVGHTVSFKNDSNDRFRFTAIYNKISKTINPIGDTTNYYIPIPTTGKYSVKVKLFYKTTDGDFSKYDDLKVSEVSKEFNSIDVNIFGGEEIMLFYNGINHNFFNGYNDWWNNLSFWGGTTLPENVDKNQAHWLIKNNLYADNKTAHTINLTVRGGRPIIKYDIQVIDYLPTLINNPEELTEKYGNYKYVIFNDKYYEWDNNNEKYQIMNARPIITVITDNTLPTQKVNNSKYIKFNEKYYIWTDDEEYVEMSTAPDVSETIVYDTISDISGTTMGCNEEKVILYRLTDYNGNGIQYPENGYFQFPVIYRPFFGEVGLFYFNDKVKDSINDNVYLKGFIYNGKTWNLETGFDVNKLNDEVIKNFSILPEANNEDYITTGDTCLTYYKGEGDTAEVINNFKVRKTILDYSIPAIYNLDILNYKTPFKFEIGNSKTVNNEVFANSTVISGDTSFFKFNFKPAVKIVGQDVLATTQNTYVIETENDKPSENKGCYYIKANDTKKYFKTIIGETITYEECGDWYNVLSIENANDYYNEKRNDFDLYYANASLYPLSDTNTPISDIVENLLRMTLQNNLPSQVKTQSDNIIFDGTNNLIYLNSDNNYVSQMDVSGGYYLIAIPKTQNNSYPQVGDSVFKSISVSKLLKYSSQVSFSPFEITCAGLLNFIEGNKNNTTHLQLFVAPKGVYTPKGGALTENITLIQLGSKNINNIPFLGNEINIMGSDENITTYKWTVDNDYLRNFKNKIIELNLSNGIYNTNVKINTNEQSFVSISIPLSELNIGSISSNISIDCSGVAYVSSEPDNTYDLYFNKIELCPNIENIV